METTISLLSAAGLGAIALLVLILLLCIVAWALICAYADHEEVEDLQEALKQAEHALSLAEERDLKQLREITRLRDALRVYEAA